MSEKKIKTKTGVFKGLLKLCQETKTRDMHTPMSFSGRTRLDENRDFVINCPELVVDKINDEITAADCELSMVARKDAPSPNPDEVARFKVAFKKEED